MLLTTQQIYSAARGAVRYEETERGLLLHRFTREQQETYRLYAYEVKTEARREEVLRYHRNTSSSAGIKLVFRTDSRSLTVDADFESANSRKFFSLNVFADGRYIGSIDNCLDTELPEIYSTVELPVERGCKSFDLGDGSKLVTVFLPFNCITYINKIELDDGSSFEPVRLDKKMIFYGDSITQGYDAVRNYNRYAHKVAEALGCEEYNKAIGGEVFFPLLALHKDDFEPDYILVAYGVNCWRVGDVDIFERKCRDFYKNLSLLYPNTKIFALSPIYRMDAEDYPNPGLGRFELFDERIPRLTQEAPNVINISGIDLVPRESRLFADGYLHPTDEGFGHYAANLIKKLTPYL
ncbi:MAG: hypothetical protein IJE90_04410 [Clostridia bacterium]|nr:hypothetical protein [Clostridia bacterium]